MRYTNQNVLLGAATARDGNKMNEKQEVRQLMTSLLENLGIDLSPDNSRLVSFKVSQGGNKAKLRGLLTVAPKSTQN